jgi:endonuclease YncB( thermonuclease family)
MLARRGNFAARRLGRGWRVALLICAIVLAIILDRAGWLLVRRVDDLAAYHGKPARVARIIDGDTLDIELPDELNSTPTTRIRLWGIDCPELSRFGEPEQPLSREAGELARTLAHGQIVLLFLEAHQHRDAYGRVLAHIEIAAGENASRSLNEALLEAGLARADDRWPHARLTRYAQIENTARRQRLGVWSR